MARAVNQANKLCLFDPQFGSKRIGKGHFKSESGLPTYVYPEALKKVVRDIVGGDIQEFENPTGESVSCYHLYLFQTNVSVHFYIVNLFINTK